MHRIELNLESGETRRINTTPYQVGGNLVLIDEGLPVPPGAEAPPQQDLNIVPQVVTRRQALLALLAAGKLDQIELLIQSAPRAVRIAWEAAGTFERDNPLIATLAPQLGLTDQDVDNLFIEAAKL